MLQRNLSRLIPIFVISVLMVELLVSCSKKEVVIIPGNNTGNPTPPPSPQPPPSPSVQYFPKAVAGPDINIMDIGFMWLLGTYTHPLNLPATAGWRKIDGPDCLIERADSFMTKVSSFTTGIYRFELTARLSSGQEVKDTVEIEVENLPVRVVSWNRIPGQVGPFWDHLTLNLTPEVSSDIDYVMIRYTDNTGNVYDWIPALRDYEPYINRGSQRGYSYQFHSPLSIFLWGSILVGEHYDVRIYY